MVLESGEVGGNDRYLTRVNTTPRAASSTLSIPASMLSAMCVVHHIQVSNDQMGK